MTNNYTIQIIPYDVSFKATFRNGKFKRIEHLRGKVDRKLMDSLGKVIPLNEKELPTLKKLWLNRVCYELEVKQKSLYTLFLEEWYMFYEKTLTVAPKFTGADGKALKQIITYLKQINSGNEPAALQNWQLILGKWETLKGFHQDNTDLKYINSRLNVIIREIIKGNGSSTAGSNQSVRI